MMAKDRACAMRPRGGLFGLSHRHVDQGCCAHAIGRLASPRGLPRRTAHPQEPGSSETVDQAICRLIETSAEEQGLPVGFFTRLIWRESSFRPHVVSQAGAQGIAQFAPSTYAGARPCRSVRPRSRDSGFRGAARRPASPIWELRSCRRLQCRAGARPAVARRPLGAAPGDDQLRRTGYRQDRPGLGPRRA